MTTLQAPAGKAIVVLEIQDEVASSGFIVATNRKTSDRGRVVSSQVADVAEGDLVLLSGEYAGSSFKLDGKTYITVVTEEILAVLGED